MLNQILILQLKQNKLPKLFKNLSSKRKVFIFDTFSCEFVCRQSFAGLDIYVVLLDVRRL